MSEILKIVIYKASWQYLINKENMDIEGVEARGSKCGSFYFWFCFVLFFAFEFHTFSSNFQVHF